MERTKLSNKGQVVIPHRIRTEKGWDAGVEFDVHSIEGGVVLRPIVEVVATSVDEVFGCLPYNGPVKSLSDMEDGIAKGAKSNR